MSWDTWGTLICLIEQLLVIFFFWMRILWHKMVSNLPGWHTWVSHAHRNSNSENPGPEWTLCKTEHQLKWTMTVPAKGCRGRALWPQLPWPSERICWPLTKMRKCEAGHAVTPFCSKYSYENSTGLACLPRPRWEDIMSKLQEERQPCSP